MGYRMLDLGLISQSLPPILILATRKSLSDLKRKLQIQIMKIKDTKTKVILIFAAAAAALLTGGCAEMGSGNTTSLLSAAGFRARTPQTPQQQQIYAALPPYQVERATVPGKGVFYVFKDEKAGLAYVGREPEYQRYQQLAIHQQIAQDYYMAAEMDRAAAWG